MGSCHIALAVVLSLLALVSAQGHILTNDNRYPGVDTAPGKCTTPDEILCYVNCTTSTWTSGVYGIPNGGRCRNETGSGAWCVGNSITTRACCAKANAYGKARFWQHYRVPSASCGASVADCGICYIWPSDAAGVIGCVVTQLTTGNGALRLAGNISTIGRKCPEIKNDPHFQGAHGTNFEFNGLPGQSFCLLTDRRLQVNMGMRGYYDSRTTGASLLKNGKAVRTWIRELGYMWVDASGVEHSFHLIARDGKSQTRDNGFLKTIELDGKKLPLLRIGEAYALAGGLKFEFMAYEKEGGGLFDVDTYRLQIDGLLEMIVKLRIAHPLLQTPDDAETHFNVHFVHVARTADVHGVMGQTYREGREQRALDYSALSRLIGRPLAADGEAGKGFLDGSVKDYRTSSVISPDCLYTSFNGHDLPI